MSASSTSTALVPFTAEVRAERRAPSAESVAGAGVQRELIRQRYSDRQDLPGIDPTRFGDWEYAGRCTDF